MKRPADAGRGLDGVARRSPRPTTTRPTEILEEQQ